MNKYDVIIIGAGIIGSMIARHLSQYKLKILIIEKECDIGMGASASNSAIIHSGHDPAPGSLKAKLNVRGNKLWGIVARELKIPFKRTGSYVVALDEEQFTGIQELYERAAVNGVWGIKVIRGEELLYREPKINPDATGALYTESTGVIDPFRACLRVCENAVNNGVHLLLNTEFQDFRFRKNRITGIHTDMGDFTCRWVINCAGLYSDTVMHKAGIRRDFAITPVRGEYLIFDASKIALNTVIYPVPTEKGKGCLVSTTTHGNVMIGPNADKISDKENNVTTPEGLEKILTDARKLLPSLNSKDVIAQFSGIRAKGNAPGKDFVIEIPDEVKGFVNLGGIESPALASAPAIAEYVAQLITEQGEKLKPREDWKPEITIDPPFRSLSHKEREELIKENPAYGRIICRCEEITEGEILEALRGTIPATTYDGIKRRTWLGTGRCQGAFDYPRVIDILARELGIPVTDVTKRGGASRLIFRKTKDVEDDGV